VEIRAVSKNSVRLDIDEQELLVLKAALNEVCNALEVPEFETRMGASLQEVEQLMGELRAAIDKVRNAATQ
jgi:hypothetical protein